MGKGLRNGGDRGGRRRSLAVWGAAAMILALPLVAMRFTDEVDWAVADFVLFGAMLAAACGAFELAARMTSDGAYRAAVAVAAVAAFILIWTNLAVGVIGSEGDPANLMYGGVLAVPVAGAFLSRGRPAGMARALSATALAHALTGVIALAAGLGSGAPSFPEAVVVLTGFFTAAWLLSAWLFRKAARERTPGNAAP